MKIEIEIPEEFEEHFNQDKFEDSLQRLMVDAHMLAGRYERELAEMLIKTFKESKPAYDIDREKFKEAIEMQEPKKPIIINKYTSDGVTEMEYRCSVCNTNYIELVPCEEWCPYCGNKFDWSDEE